MPCSNSATPLQKRDRFRGMRIHAIACLALLSLAGCRGANQEAEIVGAYEFRAAWGCARLDVRADHSFTQKIMVQCADRDAQLLNGKWEAADLGTRASHVRFAPYITLTPTGAGPTVDQNSAALEKGPFRDLAISIFPDEGLEYVKTH